MELLILTQHAGRRGPSILLVLLVTIATLASAIGSATAQNLVQPPAAQSPHWPHINTADFGRALPFTGDMAIRTAGYDWFAKHIDLAEAHGNVSEFHSRNANMKIFVYQLDLYVIQNPDAANLPENYFLHFSEDTQLKFYGLDRREIATITVPGCPSPSPITINCRVQVYNWSDKGWVFNLSDPQFQTWKAQRLLTNIGRSSQGVFLDAHGPGFTLSHSWGVQTVALSGSGIREFGGQRPGADLDRSYNAAMVIWLDYLYTQFNQVGKFVLVNTAGYMLDQLSADQFMAGRGLDTEFMHRPDAWAGSYQYQRYIDLLKDLVSRGGIVDLHGTWCYQGPSGYTAGNYSSSLGRYKMWRLASYYQVKEPVGSTGMIYFNTAFCSNSSIQLSTDQSEWLPAYQVNVGQPAGDTITYQQGTAGIASSDGRPCPYTIFARHYTNAMILVRPKDFWDCTDYGNGSAAVVTLPEPGYVLREDGSLSAQTTTVALRNAEAVIVYGISTAPSNISLPPSTVTANTSTQTLTSITPTTPTTPTTTITPTPSTSSTSASPPATRPSMQQPTGLLGKLKGLMQRVK